VESTGLHLKMSPPLSETTFETESTGVQLDYVGEGKVLNLFPIIFMNLSIFEGEYELILATIFPPDIW